MDFLGGAADYRRGAENAEKGKRFNTEDTEENRRTQRKQERSFGRHEAKAPPSLRKITQGKQDDDACRIVRKAEGTEKAGEICVPVGARLGDDGALKCAATESEAKTPIGRLAFPGESFGAQGVHDVDARGAGCGQDGGYYCGG